MDRWEHREDPEKRETSDLLVLQDFRACRSVAALRSLLSSNIRACVIIDARESLVATGVLVLTVLPVNGERKERLGHRVLPVTTELVDLPVWQELLVQRAVQAVREKRDQKVTED